MDDSKVNTLIELITRNIKLNSDAGFSDRLGNNLRQDAINEAQHALAVEFGRRRGWRRARHTFGFKTIAENKVWTIADGEEGRFGARDHAYTVVNSGGAPSSVIDHPFCFRDASKRAVALAVHLYDFDAVADEVKQAAARYGLIAEVPTDFPSWWHPGWTKLVVYRRDSEPVGSRGKMHGAGLHSL